MTTEYIDMTPTWLETAHMLMVVLENGTPAGRKAAREELRRMARLADAYVAQQNVASQQSAQTLG